tara:strand:- start:357 stop:1337 length:981 start_codon:yes stop_codon:yes gene_type:complete
MKNNVDTIGIFNFLDDEIQSSLYRNGKLITRRDSDGSDAGIEGVVLRKVEKKISNARLLEHSELRRTCEQNGFELMPSPLSPADIDFFDNRQVTREYYPDCARLVSEITGTQAWAFDHNIRSASGKTKKTKIKNGQQVQGPAHVVHGDYTLRSAPERLQQLAREPGNNDTLRTFLPQGATLLDHERVENLINGRKRFSIINVWRNIDTQPVYTHPIALCDGKTVKPEDLAVFEIHYQDRIGENYFSKNAERHQFYFYPSLTRDEVLLIKQWDSEGMLAKSGGNRGDLVSSESPCTFSFHSAFEDPATPEDAPDRWSVETRCIALYE